MARPALKRLAVDYIVAHYGLGKRRACRIVRRHRSVQYYRSCKDPRTALRARMHELAQIRMRYGYRRLHVLLRREGWTHGRELTHRLYTEEALQLRSKRPRRRKMAVSRRERYGPKRPNQASHVVNGDTIDVKLTSGRIRVRLHAIDTPERGQPWGKEAAQALSAMVMGQQVELEPFEQDRYDRLVARVFLAGRDINGHPQ